MVFLLSFVTLHVICNSTYLISTVVTLRKEFEFAFLIQL